MSACHCTAYETCFPCRERAVHAKPKPPGLGLDAVEPSGVGTEHDWPSDVAIALMADERAHMHESEAPGVEPAERAAEGARKAGKADSFANAPGVEPATDEQMKRLVAGLDALPPEPVPDEAVHALIARVRETEGRVDLAVRWAEQLLGTITEKQAEVARLREQVERMRDVVEAAQRVIDAPRGNELLRASSLGSLSVALLDYHRAGEAG